MPTPSPNALSRILHSMSGVVGRRAAEHPLGNSDSTSRSHPEGLREVTIRLGRSPGNVGTLGADREAPDLDRRWEPMPSVRAHAGGESDAEAVIVQLASLVTLGVRVADQTEWYDQCVGERFRGNFGCRDG